VSRAELVQLVTNLAANACEAMTLPGTLELCLAPAEGDYVRLTVSDTGPGIAEHMRPSLFELGASTNGDARGVGLSVVARLLHRRAGRVEVGSGDAGTTFHVLLPRAPAHVVQRR
jgi:signal transduction histidine kinase